jgi:hypothetical protein
LKYQNSSQKEVEMAFIDRHQELSSGTSVRGIASGVIFLALFGTLWAVLGIEGLKGLDENWLAAGTILVGFTLLGGGISFTTRVPGQFGSGRL